MDSCSFICWFTLQKLATNRAGQGQKPRIASGILCGCQEPNSWAIWGTLGGSWTQSGLPSTLQLSVPSTGFTGCVTKPTLPRRSLKATSHEGGEGLRTGDLGAQVLHSSRAASDHRWTSENPPHTFFSAFSHCATHWQSPNPPWALVSPSVKTVSCLPYLGLG